MSKLFLKKIRIALTPRSFLLRTRLQSGVMVSGFNREGYGGRGAYLFGDSLEPELSCLQEFLQSGFIFIDIGANVGVYTLKAARQVRENGLVIAVEPFLDTACRLSRNVAENGFGNVRIRNFAINRETGATILYLNKGKPNSFGLVPAESAASISVLSVSLDDLCHWENLSRVDYIKIDAEGSEAAILEGASETLGTFRPIVQIEVTKGVTALPRGYRRFLAAKGGPNHVFIPAENETALRAATTLGWTEVHGSGRD
jgi:FkbM family methyltransferase